jgi:hypothetical protein
VPLIVLAVGLLAFVLLSIAMLPMTLVLRYRAGSARRLARGWVATVNVVMLSLSIALFLTGAGITSYWVPDAFRYSLMGFGVGCVLGLLGLAATRWEATPRALHYTPNRVLVLAITLIVAVRLAYGFWRTWQAWRAGLDHVSWVAASGVAGSLAAGAVVLGYYFVYWIGVKRRLKHHSRRLVRLM